MQKIVLALAAASASAFVGPAATRLATKINTATIEPETPEEEARRHDRARRFEEEANAAEGAGGKHFAYVHPFEGDDLYEGHSSLVQELQHQLPIGRDC